MGFQLYQAQLVKAGFLNHQQIDIFFLKCATYFSPAVQGFLPRNGLREAHRGYGHLVTSVRLEVRRKGMGFSLRTWEVPPQKRDFRAAEKRKTKPSCRGIHVDMDFF